MALNKAVKITLIVCGACFLGFVLLIATCVGGAVMLFKGPAEAADKLVQLCGANKIHECYQLTSPGFQKETDEAAFSELVHKTGLDKGQSTSWRSRNIENDHGAVAGTVRTSDGRTLQLEVQSVHQDGRWLITAFKGGEE
jgi:hypothetical protein